MTAPLWIDTDMGFDDMLAIMMVARAGRPVAGCSLVFGNTRFDQVRRNAAAMAAFLGWSFPICPGAQRAMLGETVTAEHVLGETGLPTRGRHLPSASVRDKETSAFTALSRWLEDVDTPVDILALGPLTNIAILALARPDLLATISRITWMGGGATRGNHTPSAEFNAFADPEAAAVVLSSDVPFRMVDLDLCRQVTVSADDLAPLGECSGERAAMLYDLFGGYIDIGLSRGRPSMALYDPVAAAAVVDETAVTFKQAAIAVETCGRLTRGRTVVDDRITGGTTWIGTTADAGRIRQSAIDALVEAAAP